MCEVLKYLIDESGYLIPPQMLEEYHDMDHYNWQKFVDRIKGKLLYRYSIKCFPNIFDMTMW